MQPASLTSASKKEVDEALVIERPVDDHPAHLALVGDAGDHGQLLARAAHGHRHWRLALGRKAAATRIGVDPRRLVTPVDLALLGFGEFGKDAVLGFQPGLHRSRGLLIGAPDGLCGVRLQRARYLPAERTCRAMPHSRSMSCITAARLHRAKSICTLAQAAGRLEPDVSYTVADILACDGATAGSGHRRVRRKVGFIR